jgi:hypothetical protein
MREELSPAEVGNGKSEHEERSEGQKDDSGRPRLLSLIEAVLLSSVAVLAAYSGYAAAKWGTQSSVTLAKAAGIGATSNRDNTDAVVTHALDSLSFNAWFKAYVVHDTSAEKLAEARFRPGYRLAFDAWLATDPAHNRNAPPGPSYMPQYVIPQAKLAATTNAAARVAFSAGSRAGDTADQYIRDTVLLATVLFLVGISGHFRIQVARMGLIGLAMALLIFSAIALIGLPAPPGAGL